MKNIVVIYFLTLFVCFSCKKENENPILGEEVVTFKINKLPENHNFEEDIFISGDFEGWSGGRDQFKLNKKDEVYSISVPKYREQINFKFTKGNWESVECQLDGNPIENRTYSFDGKDETIELEIVNWSTEEMTESPSTASKNVSIFEDNFLMPQLDRQRTIRVYLPPNYHNSEDNYPVLYMHDGQNVFDKKTSYSGEWQVDETLDKLYEEKGFSLIVVAIDNGGDKRLNEYSPWNHKKFGKGEGMDYAKFIVNTLKPKIDQTFRTKTDKNNTAIMGSSMGGLISHYTALQYADVFGKAGVFSPSFWYSEDVFDFSKKHSNIKDLRLYFLAGGKEGGNPTFEGISKTAKDMNTMIDVLKSGGFPAENINSKIEPEGEHNEKLWKNSFEEAITWLFKLKNK